MRKVLTILASTFSIACGASAAVVNFTGGTAYWNDHDEVSYDPITETVKTNAVAAGSAITAGDKTYRSVDYYLENGFKFDYVGGFGGSIGNYYGGTNDVIHGHWGDGEMTGIEITKVGGGTFDFNYFVLTSNTLTPGGPATGLENVNVQAWLNGSQVGSNFKLPSEDWGIATFKDVYFNSDFDLVDKVIITSDMTGFACFGMDAFYIDQVAPIPEPSALSLIGFGLAGLAILHRRS